MKTIIDYPAYQISEYGEVYSLRLNRVLKPDASDPRGYLRITLCKLVNGHHTKKRIGIHRLVGQYYVDNLLKLPHINHLDNNPSNNNKDNLEWCNHSENMLHCHKQNRCSNIIASIKAKNDMTAKMLSKFSTLLGNRFIDYRCRDEKGYVVYRCIKCDKILESRTDSTTFNNGGMCRSCSKMKI